MSIRTVHSYSPLDQTFNISLIHRRWCQDRVRVGGGIVLSQDPVVNIVLIKAARLTLHDIIAMIWGTSSLFARRSISRCLCRALIAHDRSATTRAFVLDGGFDLTDQIKGCVFDELGDLFSMDYGNGCQSGAKSKCNGYC